MAGIGAVSGAGAGGAVASGAGSGDARARSARIRSSSPSFDKVQVKYEMLRAHVLDGQTATAAAGAHGYSRASFYLVAAAFEQSGMVGLLDERPGRRGPVKLSPEVLAFLEARRRERPGASGAELAGELERALGVTAAPAHGRAGARGRGVSSGSGRSPRPRRPTTSSCARWCSRAEAGDELLAARRFERRGLAGLIALAAVRAGLSGLGGRRAPAGVVGRARIRARRSCATPTASCSVAHAREQRLQGGRASEGRALRARLDRAPAGARHDRSQLEALRAAAQADGHEVVEEFVDDGLLRRAAGPPGAGPPARRRRGRRRWTASCACAPTGSRAPTPTRY